MRVVARWLGPVLLAALLAACGDEAVSSSATTTTTVAEAQRYEASLTVLESPDHGPELCDAVADSLPPQCDGLPVVGWDWAEVDAEESANGTTWGSFHVVGTYDDGRFVLTEPPRSPRERPERPATDDFAPACDAPDVVDVSHGIAEWEAAAGGGGLDIPELVSAWVSDPAGPWDGPFVASVVVRPGSGDDALAAVRGHYGGPLCVVERDAPTEAELNAVQEELVDDDATASLGVRSSYPDTRRGVVVASVWVDDARARDYVEGRWGALVALEGILQPVG